MHLILTLALQGGTTLGEVRPHVPAALRPPAMPAPAQNGWSLALKAAGRSNPRPARSDAIPNANSEGRTVSDLLQKWRSKPDRADIPAVKRALAPYGLRIHSLRSALAKPVWAMPRPSNSTRPTLDPAIADFEANAAHKELAKALCLRAYLNALEGQGSAAVADIALARGLGSRLAGGGTPMVPYMVGIAIEAIADDAALHLAAMPTLLDKELAALQRVVGAKPEPSRLVNTLRVEFDTYAITIAAALPSDPRSMLPASWGPALAGQKVFDRRDTVVRLAAPFLTAIENRDRLWSKQVNAEAAAKRDAPEPPVGQGKLTASEVSRLRAWFGSHPNYLGRQFAATLASYATKAEEIERKALARQRLTVAAISVRRLTLKTGKRPATLTAPIPADPFGPGPIRYNARTGRLWSVGPDGRDDGGKGKPNGVKPDMVIDLPHP